MFSNIYSTSPENIEEEKFQELQFDYVFLDLTASTIIENSSHQAIELINVLKNSYCFNYLLLCMPTDHKKIDLKGI
jgi:hypothetical protein